MYVVNDDNYSIKRKKLSYTRVNSFRKKLLLAFFFIFMFSHLVSNTAEHLRLRHTTLFLLAKTAKKKR